MLRLQQALFAKVHLRGSPQQVPRRAKQQLSLQSVSEKFHQVALPYTLDNYIQYILTLAIKFWIQNRNSPGLGPNRKFELHFS